MERVGRPVMNASIRLLGVVLPSSLIAKLRWRLTLAGDPIGVTGLLVIWAVCGLLVPASYFVLVSLGGARGHAAIELPSGAVAATGTTAGDQLEFEE